MKIEKFSFQFAVSIFEAEASSIFSKCCNSQFEEFTSVTVTWENETKHIFWSFLSKTLFDNRQGWILKKNIGRIEVKRLLQGTFFEGWLCLA